MSSAVPPLIRTEDNAFWFDAASQGRLVVQRCSACGALRHPPGPACPICRSFEWDAIDAPLRGTLHSFTIVHHPPDGSLSYPLAVGLIDLETGTRLLADFESGTSLEALEIGMAVEIGFAEHAHGEVLPRLRLLPEETP